MIEQGSTKLTEYAYAIEQIRRADETLHFLRQLLGTLEADRNVTVAFVDGYKAAMKRIVYQSEI